MSLSPVNPSASRIHSMPFGAQVLPDNSVHFRLWAPAVDSIRLRIEGLDALLPLTALAGGWFEIITDSAQAGSLYQFLLPDGTAVPDPASRYQPRDVHGPSQVIDPGSYHWQDAGWQGRPWSEAVIYELHIGAFTPEGTFLAAIDKLDHLVNLGITAIELMPVADFPGQRNWGYDGVLLYAPDSSYGTPDQMKALIDAAHQRGLMVLLDVVYNHFGPDGNYLPLYAPQIFTDHHKTPWGDAVNYDAQGSEVVREFILHNALYWIDEFHLDGLRLDAVHAIKDDTNLHLLDELAQRARAIAAPRPIHLILENEKNQASRLTRNADGQPTTYTAQWNDDIHHVLHTAVTGESNGYYASYNGDIDKLGRALAEGFAYQGQHMSTLKSTRGEPSAHLYPGAFVSFMQNHDQVGNRAYGDRITGSASTLAVRAIAAVYLLLPQTPMLFMGEEWASSQPFPFFCDFDGQLGELVRNGRREEFAAFPEFQDPEMREHIPDPQSEATFLAAKLDWTEPQQGIHAEWLDWYRRILAVRRASIVPLVEQLAGNAASYEILGAEVGQAAVVVRFHDRESTQQLTLVANLSDKPAEGIPPPAGTLLWQEGSEQHGATLAPWSLRWEIAPI